MAENDSTEISTPLGSQEEEISRLGFPSQEEMFEWMCFIRAVRGDDCLMIARSLNVTPKKVKVAVDNYLGIRASMEATPGLISARLDYYLRQLEPHIANNKAWAIKEAVLVERLRIELLGLARTVIVEQPVRYVIQGVDMKELM